MRRRLALAAALALLAAWLAWRLVTPSQAGSCSSPGQTGQGLVTGHNDDRRRELAMTDKDPRRPGVGQDSLMDPAEVDRPTWRLEAAVKRSIEAARLDPRDEGMGQLAVESALAIDVAQRRRDPYAVAAVARELRETLTRLQLDPASRADGTDDLDQLLAQLGTPTADTPLDDRAP